MCMRREGGMDTCGYEEGGKDGHVCVEVVGGRDGHVCV